MKVRGLWKEVGTSGGLSEDNDEGVRGERKTSRTSIKKQNKEDGREGEVVLGGHAIGNTNLHQDEAREQEERWGSKGKVGVGGWETVSGEIRTRPKRSRARMHAEAILWHSISL